MSRYIKCDVVVRKQIEEKYGSSYEAPVAFFKLLEMMDKTGCSFNPDFSKIADSNEELEAMEDEFEKLWNGYKEYLDFKVKENAKKDLVTTIKTEFEEVVEEKKVVVIDDDIEEEF